MTIPKDFVDLESDHNMVTADLNIGNYFCHPQIAHKVALKKTKVDGRPREQELIDHVGGANVTQIRHPGSMQWFHVKRPDAGTYSIGADRPDVNMDIYLPDNLTTPISRYFGGRGAADGNANRGGQPVRHAGRGLVHGAADSGAYQTVKLAAVGLPDPDN